MDGTFQIDYSNLGSQPDPVVPGVNQSYADNNPSPPISTSQSWWDSLKKTGSSFETKAAGYWDAAVETIEESPQTTATALKNDLSVVTSGAKSVVTSATSIATSAIDPLLTRILIVVIVLGGVLYFIGKSGAIGQASNFMPKVG